MPPARCWGHFCARRALDEAWRVALAISATAVVAGCAYFAIRFIIGLQLRFRPHNLNYNTVDSQMLLEGFVTWKTGAGLFPSAVAGFEFRYRESAMPKALMDCPARDCVAGPADQQLLPSKQYAEITASKIRSGRSPKICSGTP